MVDLKLLGLFAVKKNEKKKELALTKRLVKRNKGEIKTTKKMIKLLEKTAGLFPDSMRQILQKLERTGEQYQKSISDTKASIAWMKSTIDDVLMLQIRMEDINTKIRKAKEKERVNKEKYETLEPIPAYEITPYQLYKRGKAQYKLERATREIQSLTDDLNKLSSDYATHEKAIKKDIGTKELWRLSLAGKRRACCGTEDCPREDKQTETMVPEVCDKSIQTTEDDEELAECVTTMLGALFEQAIMSFLIREKIETVSTPADDNKSDSITALEGATCADWHKIEVREAPEAVDGLEKGDSLTYGSPEKLLPFSIM